MNPFRTLLLTIVFAAKAAAQSPSPSPPLPSPVPPSGDLLSRAPEFARWTFEESRLAGDPKAATTTGSPDPEIPRKKKNSDATPPASAAGPANRTTVTKTGSIFHLESERAGSKTEEKWCRPDVQVTRQPDSPQPMISVPGNPQDAAYVDFSATDFPDCSWISRKNYLGLEQHDDHSCLTFKDLLVLQPNDGPLSQAEPLRIGVTAYIDYYSRLPVALIRGDTTRTYRYEMPPPQLLVIPDEIVQVVKQHEQKIKELSFKPAKPF